MGPEYLISTILPAVVVAADDDEPFPALIEALSISNLLT
jgi:hypothetical protein